LCLFRTGIFNYALTVIFLLEFSPTPKWLFGAMEAVLIKNLTVNNCRQYYNSRAGGQNYGSFRNYYRDLTVFFSV